MMSTNCRWRSAAARDTRGHRVMRTLLLLFSACLLSQQALAGRLDAQIDRTRIADGETVTLRLSASGDTQGDPDLGPLTDDFDILSQGQSTQMSFINGRGSTTREWQLVLMPKRSGQLTIPALRIGGAESQPLRLEVAAPDVAQNGATRPGQPVMIEVEVEPEQPYVQAEVNYRVKILSRVPLREASLSEPRAGDAIVERLGEDSSYTTQRNGETYQVIERRYAIFPQHSGALQIESPVLSAAVPAGNSRRGGGSRFPGGGAFADIERFFGRNPFAGFPDMGDLFEETRPVRVRGRVADLEVRPQPAASPGPWLPAKNLTLSETWSPDPPVFRVGEPVTRTVEVVAEGLTAAQLPALTPPVPDGVKLYPDQPQNQTRSQGGDLVATRTLKAALVPSVTGSLTLPEMKLSWWDTEAHQARVATLPGRTIEVLPAKAGTQAAPAGPEAAQAAPSEDTPVTTTPREASPSTPGTDSSQVTKLAWQAGYWPWLAGAAGLGWLLTAVLWLRARRRTESATGKRPGVAPGQPSHRQRLTHSRTRLRNACKAGDAKAARTALLDWADARWPEQRPRGLSDLARRLPTEQARTEVDNLNRILYDPGSKDSWDGRHAWAFLDQALKEAQSEADTGSTEELPDLYPQHG
jgi:hypothetical protein